MQRKRMQKETLPRTGLSLPEDVLKSCPVITLVGRKEVTVEGHDGIMTCETDRVCIRVKDHRLVICGSGLILDYYQQEEAKICGYIHGIWWENL